MNRPLSTSRWGAPLMTALLALAVTASGASAGDRGYHDGSGPVVRVVAGFPITGSYVLHRPVAGGFVCGSSGGVSFGFTLANVAPAGYVYYDPWDRPIVSLSAYYAHCRRMHLPYVVRVARANRGWYADRHYNHRNAYDDRYAGRQGRRDHFNHRRDRGR
jgi:hypothetical protein